MPRYLMDTDVLIDALRLKREAHEFISRNTKEIAVSLLTVAELYAGVRAGKEEKDLAALLSLFPKVDISEAIALQGGIYCNHYGKSHGTGIIDAMLAATATEEGMTLVTLNKKHFPMLKAVLTPYKKS